jgi:hypothetical protein
MDLTKKMLHRRIGRDHVLVPRYSPTWENSDIIPVPTQEPTDPDPPAQDPNPSPTPKPDPPVQNTPKPSPQPTPTPKPAPQPSPSPSPKPEPEPQTTSQAPPPPPVETPSTTSTPTLTSTTLVTTPVIQPTTPIVVQTTLNVPTASFGSANLEGSTSALPSATAGTNGGASVGSIVGIAAGVVGGLAVIAVVILWFLRRQRRAKEEEYQEENYRAQSMMIPDEDPMGRFDGAPRPPTMIERKYNNQAPSFTQQYGSYNFPQQGGYESQYGYGDAQPSFTPGQVMPSPTSAMPFAPAATAPSAYLTRSPSNGSHEGHLQPRHDDGYADVNRASVTPYQEQQYQEISRQLNIAPPAAAVTTDSSPFGDRQRVLSPPPVLPDHRAMSPMGVPRAQSQSFTIPGANQSRAPTQQNRPNTVYDEDDAYGGF